MTTHPGSHLSDGRAEAPWVVSKAVWFLASGLLFCAGERQPEVLLADPPLSCECPGRSKRDCTELVRNDHDEGPEALASKETGVLLWKKVGAGV